MKELPKIKIWHAVVWTAVSTPEVPRETWCGFSRTPWSKRQGVTRGHPLRTEHRRRPTSTWSSLECLIHTMHAIKCWACLRRNISRVCECFYLPPNTAKDNSRQKKLRKNLLYCSKYETCWAPEVARLFKRYRFDDRENHLLFYLQDIGPICFCHFYCGFPPSQSMHSDPWILSRVHLTWL